MSTTRIIPLTGTDRVRQIFALAGKLLNNEIHTTSQFRLFMQNILIGPVWQGVVADEATMLALDGTATRGCFPGDWCKRTDTGTYWMCITNRGALLADWAEISGGGGGGTYTADDVTLQLVGSEFSIKDAALLAVSSGITTAGLDLISDADNAAQRATLGLGDSATKDVGQTAGKVAAGDDPRFAGGGGSVATGIIYDNTVSTVGLKGDNVQTAIDELKKYIFYKIFGGLGPTYEEEQIATQVFQTMQNQIFNITPTR